MVEISYFAWYRHNEEQSFFESIWNDYIPHFDLAEKIVMLGIAGVMSATAFSCERNKLPVLCRNLKEIVLVPPKKLTRKTGKLTVQHMHGTITEVSEIPESIDLIKTSDAISQQLKDSLTVKYIVRDRRKRRKQVRKRQMSEEMYTQMATSAR